MDETTQTLNEINYYIKTNQFKKAEANISAHLNLKLDIELLKQQVFSYIKQSRFDDALEKLQEILKNHDDSEAILIASALLNDLSQYQIASDLVAESSRYYKNKATKLSHLLAESLANTAITAMMVGKDNEALSLAEKAITYHSTQQKAHKVKVKILLKNGQYSQAFDQLKDLLDHDQIIDDELFLLAGICLSKQDIDHCRIYFQKALSQNKDSICAKLLLHSSLWVWLF